ncbi:hypothetical protein HNY73_008103 [Argiope bruennichi]|uniref:Uncharacterized protein n=1 Tax=Argiope bruennichi TaxID=94029 RepID=A0A8T0F7L5_ARGBR|nr:hypothetical protein HNY73_008103 [Argiope bruennichi]
MVWENNIGIDIATEIVTQHILTAAENSIPKTLGAFKIGATNGGAGKADESLEARECRERCSVGTISGENKDLHRRIKEKAANTADKGIQAPPQIPEPSPEPPQSPPEPPQSPPEPQSHHLTHHKIELQIRG